MTGNELPPKPAKLVRHLRNYHTLMRLNEKAAIEREREEAQVKKAVETITDKPEEPVNGATSNVLWSMLSKKIDDTRLILFEFEERLVAMEDQAAKKNGN